MTRWLSRPKPLDGPGSAQSGEFLANRPRHARENCYPIAPMKCNLVAMLIGLLLLAGCNGPGQAPSSDPFLLGQTRIPPPGTGEAAGRPPDPAYSTPPSSSSAGWQPAGAPAAKVVPTTSAQQVSAPGFAPAAADSRALSAAPTFSSGSSSSTVSPATTPSAPPFSPGLPRRRRAFLRVPAPTSLPPAAGRRFAASRYGVRGRPAPRRITDRRPPAVQIRWSARGQPCSAAAR